MAKTIIAVTAALAAVVAYAGDSAPFPLDTLDGTRVARDVETIVYSTAWANGAPAGAQAVVAVDGETFSAASGEGEVAWTHPARAGTFTLTHAVVSGGTQYGETQTATFLVRGPDAPVFTPPSGTIIEDGSLTVSISCPTEGATIHYTTDGTEPTEQSPVYRRFRVSAKTVVKAVAVRNGLLGDVAVAEYAPGRCAVPVISPADGASFAHSNQVVSIAWKNDGVLRYTLDGTDPTAGSAAYAGLFTVGESTVVKAKVFSDELLDSYVATARLSRVWTRMATPVIGAAATFSGPRTLVELSCTTDGALIRYTLDGGDPDSGSTVYTEPFYVTNSCTVKAYAALADYLDSATATFAIEKIWNPGDALGAPEHAFYTDGDGGLGWTRVADATAPGGDAMKSGAITHSQSSVLSTTVMGPGTLAFAWRTSCEEDPMYEWDHAEFAVDGTVMRRLCGETAWTNECVEIVGDGAHAVEWRYVKDGMESEGEDAAWVADYRWESAWTATRTTVVPVPYAWLAARVPGVVDEYEEYEAAAKMTAANGRKVWECYVLGLDPEVATNDFRIVSFPMKADGTPDLTGIVFEPPHEQWNVPDAPVTWKGAAKLEGPWRTVSVEGGSPGTARPTMQFFKAVVFGDADDDEGGVQLWEGGPYWAECNVGATKPEEYGYYFWWGDTVGYTRSGGTWNDYDWGDGSGYYSGVTWVASTGVQMDSSPFDYASCPTYGKDNSALLSAGYIDSTGNLVAAHDAATAHLGAPWRMPTDAEFSALCSKCTTKWTTRNGVYGRFVTGKGDYADRSIFLPAAGYGSGSSLGSPGSGGYGWSSSPSSDLSYGAWYLYFYSSDFFQDYYYRYFGQSVRPVRGFAQ